jgi:hypothetical protein
MRRKLARGLPASNLTGVARAPSPALHGRLHWHNQSNRFFPLSLETSWNVVANNSRIEDGYVRAFPKHPKHVEWSALEDDFRTFLLLPLRLFSSLQPESWFAPKSMSAMGILQQLTLLPCDTSFYGVFLMIDSSQFMIAACIAIR